MTAFNVTAARSLIKRLEKARRGSDRLDDEVAKLIGWEDHGRYWLSPDKRLKCFCKPSFHEKTTDLAAALSFRPLRCMWSITDMESGPCAQIIRPMPDGSYVGGVISAKASTVELAMTAAILKAIVASEEDMKQ